MLKIFFKSRWKTRIRQQKYRNREAHKEKNPSEIDTEHFFITVLSKPDSMGSKLITLLLPPDNF